MVNDCHQMAVLILSHPGTSSSAIKYFSGERRKKSDSGVEREMGGVGGCEGDVQVIKRRERKKLEIKRSVLILFTSHDHFNFHRINSFNCYLNTFKSISASDKNTFFIIFRV